MMRSQVGNSDSKKRPNITLYLNEQQKQPKKPQYKKISAINNRNLRIKEKINRIKTEMSQLSNISHMKQIEDKNKKYPNAKRERSYKNGESDGIRESNESQNTACFYNQKQRQNMRINIPSKNGQLRDQFGGMYGDRNYYKEEVYSPQLKPNKIDTDKELRVYTQPMEALMEKEKQRMQSFKREKMMLERNGEEINQILPFNLQADNDNEKYYSKHSQNHQSASTPEMTTFTYGKIARLKLPPKLQKFSKHTRYGNQSYSREKSESVGGYLGSIYKNDLRNENRQSLMLENKSSLNRNRNYRHQRDLSLVERPQRNESKNSREKQAGSRENCRYKNTQANLYDDQQNQKMSKNLESTPNRSERNESVGRIVKNVYVEEDEIKRKWKQKLFQPNLNYERNYNKNQSNELKPQKMNECAQKMEIKMSNKEIQTSNKESNISSSTKAQNVQNKSQFKMTFYNNPDNQQNKLNQDIQIKLSKNNLLESSIGNSNNSKLITQSQNKQTQFIMDKQLIQSHNNTIIDLKLSNEPTLPKQKLSPEDYISYHNKNEMEAIDSIQQMHYFMVEQIHKVRQKFKKLECTNQQIAGCKFSQQSQPNSKEIQGSNK